MGFDYSILIKIALIAIELFYAFFAVVLVRQVKLMRNSFRTSYGILFTVIAVIHFLAVLGLIAITFLLL